MPAFLKNKHRSLWSGALGLVLLPGVCQASGLTLESARIRSQSVQQWRQRPEAPDKHTPVVFALGR